MFPSSAAHGAADTWVVDFPRERALWSRSLPFIRIDNGDFIAIGTKGRIIYLNHEDESRPIADSFDEFMSAWPRICYLGPEIWYLEPFLKRSGSGLAVASAKAEALRALFAAQ